MRKNIFILFFVIVVVVQICFLLFYKNRETSHCQPKKTLDEHVTSTDENSVLNNEKTSTDLHRSEKPQTLTIFINTFPRGNLDYLIQVLDSIDSQFPLILGKYFDIYVHVINMAPIGEHPIFDKAITRFSHLHHINYSFHHLDDLISQKIIPDWNLEWKLKAQNGKHFTHTFHVLSLLRFAQKLDGGKCQNTFSSSSSSSQSSQSSSSDKKSKGLKNYTMILEDDFIFCPHAHYHLFYLLKELIEYKYNDFLITRFSFGLNGILFDICGSHVQRTIQYIVESGFNVDYPVDSLITTHWVQDYPEQPYVTYRLNIMDHIGDQSIKNKDQVNRNLRFAKCYDFLYSVGQHIKELFDPNRKCLHKDMSPCDRFGDHEANQFARHFSHLHSFQVSDMTPLFQYYDNSKREYHSYSLDYDPSSPTLSERILKNLVVRADFGKSCTSACAEISKICAPHLFQMINNCFTLKLFAKEGECDTCSLQEIPDIDTPSYLSYEPSQRPICLMNPLQHAMGCDGQTQRSSRICPCV